MMELLDKGEELPFPIEGAAVYYVGPTPERPGCAIAPLAPPPAAAWTPYTPRLLDLGLACMIGKGKRSEAVKQSVVKNEAVYLAAIGGAGALMANSVQSCEIIAWPDLGCEAVRKLVVKDFPLTVLLDTYGGDLYQKRSRRLPGQPDLNGEGSAHEQSTTNPPETPSVALRAGAGHLGGRSHPAGSLCQRQARPAAGRKRSCCQRCPGGCRE